MVTTIKGIDLGDTGIRESSLATRKRIEDNQWKTVKKISDEALKRLKKITETETGEPAYISFPISKFLEEYGFSAEDRTIKTRLAYTLRQSCNIVTQLGEAENRVVPDNMKPFAYSYVPEEVKERMGLDAYCMKNLSKEMKEYIQQRTQKAGAKSEIYDLLLVCDYLTAHNAHKQWYKLMGLKLSADLGQPVMRTKEALEDLIAAHILLTGQIKRNTRGKDTICRLAYDIKEYSTLNNQLLSGEAEDDYRAGKGSETIVDERLIERKIETVDEKIIPMDKAKSMVQSIQADLDKGLGLSSHEKLTPMNDSARIENIISSDEFDDTLSKEDMMCLRHLISRLKNSSPNKAESNESNNEKALKRLQDLLAASQEENNKLRKEIANLESEKNKLSIKLEKHERFNEAYAKEARKAMNQLISSVSSSTEWFTKIPAKKLDEDNIAEFKNQVFEAATGAQNRLRDFTYSELVEPLKK